MLKNSSLPSTPSMTGKVASTTGTAPRRPAQPEDDAIRRGEAVEGRADDGGGRPREEHEHQRQRGALGGRVAQLAREHEQAEGEEHDDLRHPAEPLVEHRDRALGGDAARSRASGPRCRRRGSPSRAARRRSRRRSRRWRASPPGRARPCRAACAAAPRRRASRRRAPRPCRYRAPPRTGAPCRRRRTSGSWIHSTKPTTSRTATGSLNPASPSSVRARLRLQRRAAQQREDRGAVGGGDDRSEQQPLQRAQVEEPDRGRAGDRRGDEGADEGEGEGRAQDRPDLLEPGGEAALEQDQGRARRSRSSARARSRPPRSRTRSSPSRPSRGPCRRPGTAAGRAAGRVRRAGKPRCRQRGVPPRRGSARRRSQPRDCQGYERRAVRLGIRVAPCTRRSRSPS